MTKMLALGLMLAVFFMVGGSKAAGFETDVFDTPEGTLKMTFIGHGSLAFDLGGKIVYVDPWSHLADYSRMPKADLILITHQHQDHLDPKAVKDVSQDKTVVIINQGSAEKIPQGKAMTNGDRMTVDGIDIQAVPAYNLVHKRDNGRPFHPKGEGNGYVIQFGGHRIYVAGDTENIPEMKSLEQIDIAFLPMNLPYTMTPEMAAEAAKSFKPGILYPYHFGESDTSKLVELMKDTPEVEVRVRPMP